MTRPELHETLTVMVEALEPQVDGAWVTEAAIEAPMEVTVSGSGSAMVFRAAPPASRFVSGIMSPVHRITMTAVHTQENAL